MAIEFTKRVEEAVYRLYVQRKETPNQHYGPAPATEEDLLAAGYVKAPANPTLQMKQVMELRVDREVRLRKELDELEARNARLVKMSERIAEERDGFMEQLRHAAVERKRLVELLRAGGYTDYAIEGK